jgi:hypothetical protein
VNKVCQQSWITISQVDHISTSTMIEDLNGMILDIISVKIHGAMSGCPEGRSINSKNPQADAHDLGQPELRPDYELVTSFCHCIQRCWIHGWFSLMKRNLLDVSINAPGRRTQKWLFCQAKFHQHFQQTNCAIKIVVHIFQGMVQTISHLHVLQDG